MLCPMKHIAHRVLFSTFLLVTACTKTTEVLVPAPATPPVTAPAQPAQQPQPAAPAPAAAAPAPDKAPAPVAAPSVADLGKLLGGIKDGATAEAAKAQLDALVNQLQTTKNATPANAATEGLGSLGKLAGDAATKLGVSADTVKQITTLLGNPAVKSAIGPTLEKLQGLLK